MERMAPLQKAHPCGAKLNPTNRISPMNGLLIPPASSKTGNSQSSLNINSTDRLGFQDNSSIISSLHLDLTTRLKTLTQSYSLSARPPICKIESDNSIP